MTINREEINYKGINIIKVGKNVTVKNGNTVNSFDLPENIDDFKEYIFNRFNGNNNASLMSQRKQLDNDMWLFVTYIDDGNMYRYGASIHSNLESAKEMSIINLETQKRCNCKYGNGYGYITKDLLERYISMVDYVDTRRNGLYIINRV